MELPTGLGDLFGVATGDGLGDGLLNKADGDGDAAGEPWTAAPWLPPPHAVAIRTSRHRICAFFIEPPTPVTSQVRFGYGHSLSLAAMNLATRAVLALLILLIIGAISGVMYLISVFLFAFSGGQYSMVSVVNLAALVVVALMIVLAAIVWKLRSPTSAAIFSAAGTPVAWVVAMFVEWGLSQFVFVTGAP